MTNAVRMIWMRTRRRCWVSETLTKSHDPYSGMSTSRPLCRVTASRTRPSRWGTLFWAFIVASASFARAPTTYGVPVRLVIAQCTVDYLGRLTAHLPSARRLLLFKADGSVSVHADDRAYKPLNWMSPPCWVTEELDGQRPVWVVENKAGEQLRITVEDIEHDRATNWASTRGWSRTASRPTCRRCWPSTSSCSEPGTHWCGAST